MFNRSIKPIYEIERKIENSLISHPVIKIKSNPFLKNIISITYDDGILDVIKISDALYESKYDEINTVNKSLSNLLN